MKEARRNTVVGLFVIVGFILLAIIILQFSNIASLTGGGYVITARLPHSSSAMRGKPVHFNGVPVGEVAKIVVAPEGKGVIMTLRIEDGVTIPSNAEFRISASGLGDSFLDFVLPQKVTGEFVEPAAPLPVDGSAQVIGASASGLGLLPKDLAGKLAVFLDKFERLDQVIDNLAAMTEARSLEEVDAGRQVPNLSTAIARFDAAVARLADQENAANIKTLLAETAVTAASFNETLEKARELIGQSSVAVSKLTADADTVKAGADRLLGKLYDDAVKMSNLLDTFNSLAKGVQEGEGTAGKLLKSDELHRQMILLMTEMQEASKALKRLLVKLEQEGLMRSGG